MLTPRIDRIDRNFIINGGCEYFQVGGASSAVAIPGSFDYASMDMFELETSGSWTSPESQRSTTKVGNRSRRSHLFTGTPAAVSDEFRMRTKIESIFAYELIDDVFSLGLKLKSDNFTEVQITVSYADTEDVFSSVTQIAQQTFTFTADSAEQEIKFENISPNPNMANGIQVQFDFKGLGSTSATNLYVGEFIVNKGKTKNKYAPAGRDQIEEFSLCKRYLEENTTHWSGDTTAGNTYVQPAEFTEVKRAVPSMSYVSVDVANFNGIGVTSQVSTTRVEIAEDTTATAGGSFFRIRWTADARL